MKDETMNDRIAFLMKTLKFDSKSFARKLGVGKESVDSVIKGKTIPSMPMMNSILKIFPFIKKEWLFIGAGEPWGKKVKLEDYVFDGEVSQRNKKDVTYSDTAVAERFKMIRKFDGVSQSIFASKLGVARDTVNAIERARQGIPYFIMIELDKQFKINLNWLFLGKGDMFTNKQASKGDKADDVIRQLRELIKSE